MKSALRIALLSLAIGLPAQANEVERGALMICDTQKQVERLGELSDKTPQAALSAVNTEANDPTACAAVDALYVQGKVLGTVRSKSHTFQVVPVIVVGINTPGDSVRSIRPCSSRSSECASIRSRPRWRDQIRPQPLQRPKAAKGQAWTMR